MHDSPPPVSGSTQVRCRCHYAQHPCDGKPFLLEPVPDCPVIEHAVAWQQWAEDGGML